MKLYLYKKYVLCVFVFVYKNPFKNSIFLRVKSELRTICTCESRHCLFLSICVFISLIQSFTFRRCYWFHKWQSNDATYMYMTISTTIFFFFLLFILYPQKKQNLKIFEYLTWYIKQNVLPHYFLKKKKEKKKKRKEVISHNSDDLHVLNI